MRFDNLHAHDALMNQLPTWFKPVLEYIALMEAYGVALDGLNEQGQAIYYNQFIQTADADTLAVWEKLFGITLRYGDTLDFRRQRLLQKFNQIVPYTVWHLRDRLTELYGEDGYTLEVDPVACTISILVTSDRYGAIDLLYDLIWDVVPAHLAVRANQETTSYAVSDQYAAGILAKTMVQNLNIRTVEKTVSGDIVSISDSAGFPAVDLSVNIEPVQDLHGYDNPWPAGGMGNFADFADITYFDLNGTITATVAADGSITINGTNPSDKASFVRGLFHCPDQTATYTWATFNTVADSNLEFSVRTADFAPAGGWAMLNAINRTNTFTVDSGKTAVYWQIQVRTGATINNVTVKPMIVSGSTAPTTYAPYSNICPITGWDEVKVTRTGVNVWDEEWEVGEYDNTGQKVNGSGVRCKTHIPVLPSTDYCLLSPNILYVCFYDADKNFISRNVYGGNTVRTTPNNAYYMTFNTASAYGTTYNHDISINYPSTDHDYHAYLGTDYTTDLPATVYGGTLDVTTGELVVDRAMVDLGTLNWTYIGKFYAPLDGAKIPATQQTVPDIMCSCYFASSYHSLVNATVDKAIGIDPSGNAYVRDSAYSNAATFKSAMQGVQLVYELTEPQTYQLSPQEVVMLAYNNTIWADCGPVVVTYKALEGDD